MDILKSPSNIFLNAQNRRVLGISWVIYYGKPSRTFQDLEMCYFHKLCLGSSHKVQNVSAVVNSESVEL